MSRSKQIKFTAGRMWPKAADRMLGATFSFFKVVFKTVLPVEDMPFPTAFPTTTNPGTT